jgi:hypothetical protein
VLAAALFVLAYQCSPQSRTLTEAPTPTHAITVLPERPVIASPSPTSVPMVTEVPFRPTSTRQPTQTVTPTVAPSETPTPARSPIQRGALEGV